MKCLTGIVDCWIDRRTGMLDEVPDEGFVRDAKVRVILGSLFHRDVALSV